MKRLKPSLILALLILSLGMTPSQAQSSREVALKQGWNLLGSDLSGLETSQFSSDTVNIIWTYEAGIWKAFSPHQSLDTALKEAGIASLERIESGSGFLLNSSQDSIISLTGLAPTSVQTLVFSSPGAKSWQLRSHPFTHVQLEKLNLPQGAKIWVLRDETWHCFDSSTASETSSSPHVLRPAEGFFMETPQNTALNLQNSFEPGPQNPLLGLRLSGSQIFGTDLTNWTLQETTNSIENFRSWFLKKGYGTLVFNLIDADGCVYFQDQTLEAAGIQCIRSNTGALNSLVEKLHESHRFVVGDLSSLFSLPGTNFSSEAMDSIAENLMTSYAMDAILMTPDTTTRNDPQIVLTNQGLEPTKTVMVFENPQERDELFHHPYARTMGEDQTVIRPLSFTLSPFVTDTNYENLLLNRHLFRALRDSTSGHFFDPCPPGRSLDFCQKSEATLENFQPLKLMREVFNLSNHSPDSRSLGNIVVSANSGPLLSPIVSRAINLGLELLESSGFKTMITTGVFNPLAEAYVLILQDSPIPPAISPLLQTSRPLLIQTPYQPSLSFPSTLSQTLGLLQDPTTLVDPIAEGLLFQSQSISFQKAAYSTQEVCWKLPIEHLESTAFAPLTTTIDGGTLALLVQNKNRLWTACSALDMDMLFVIRQVLNLPGGFQKPADSLFYNAPRGAVLTLAPTQDLTVMPEFHAGNILANRYPANNDSQLTVLKSKALTSAYPIFMETSELLILHPNHAPVAKAGSDRLIAPDSMIRLTGLGLDQDYDSLSFSWTQSQGPSLSLIDPGQQSVRFQSPLKSNLDQKIVLSLAVSDGKTSSEIDLIELTLVANQPPEIQASPEQSAPGSSKVLISVLGSDPDSDPLSYEWQQISGPLVTLNSTEIAAPEFLAPPKTNTVQTLKFLAMAKDGLSSSNPATITVNILANQSPVVFIDTPVHATGTRPFALHASSFDPDQEPLEYLWRQISGPAAVLNTSVPATPQSQGPDTSTSAELVFGVRVSDGLSLSREKNITVLLKPSPIPTCIDSSVEICIE